MPNLHWKGYCGTFCWLDKYLNDCKKVPWYNLQIGFGIESTTKKYPGTSCESDLESGVPPKSTRVLLACDNQNWHHPTHPVSGTFTSDPPGFIGFLNSA